MCSWRPRSFGAGSDSVVGEGSKRKTLGGPWTPGTAGGEAAGGVYEVEPHHHPERTALSYPPPVGDKPSWAGFKAGADGGRHRGPWCIGARLSTTRIPYPGPLLFCRWPRSYR